MKVLVVRSNHCNPDPRVAKVCQFLQEQGVDVTVLAWERSGMKEKVKFPWIQEYITLRAPHGGGLSNLPALILYQFLLFFRLLSKYKQVDVVHACNLDTGLTSAIFCKLTKKKLVYDCFDFYVDAFPVPNFARNLVRRIELGVINYADLVILASEARTEQISGSAPKSLGVLPNVPPYQYNAGAKTNHPYLKICYVGTLTAHRFIPEMIQMTNENEFLRLEIAGFGELSSEIENCAKANNRITFHGQVSYDDGLKISSEADLLFAMYDPKIPNHKFSAPNKFYEAAMLGIPIVVVRGTSVDLIVNNYKTGYVCDYSLASFREVLTRVLNNPQEAKMFGDNGLKVYMNEYRPEIVKSNFWKLYKMVLDD